MRFVYFGTPAFATIILDELKKDGHIPSLIITAPDRPKGRHLTLTPSEVKVWGLTEGIPVLTPEKIDDGVLAQLSQESFDFFIVAAYGKILPQALLDIPKHGTLNVHPSLLPKFRGSSPIESAILSDEKETGVTIMLLDALLDHGPIVTQKIVPVDPWPPKGSVLTELLAHEGGKLLGEAMRSVISGTIIPKDQDHQRATFTKKIQKGDGEVNLEGDPLTTFKKIKAFDEWPGAFFFATRKDGQNFRVLIKDATCEDGALTILRVIPEGKKEMDYQDFLRGM